MGRKQADVVATAAVAVLACAAAIIGAPTAVMAVLGLVLFAAPGYLLAQVLLPGSRIAGLERAAVAAGLALAVPILGGLLLYAVGVPLHRSGWLGLLAGATIIADAALLLRRRAGHAAPFILPSAWRVPRQKTAIFAAAVLLAAGGVALARVGAAKQPQPGFTQLWLSPGHNAHTAGLGISNDEGRVTRYRLVLRRNGQVSGTWNLTLANGRTWQRTVPFTGKFPLSANLYRLPDLAHPYRYVATGPTAVPGSSKAAGS
jgi:uncharacterized membrane protein